MKQKINKYVILIFSLLIFGMAFAEKNIIDPALRRFNSQDWRTVFRDEIRSGSLYDAVSSVVRDNPPKCDVMKEALKMGFNDFAVLKAIFSAWEDIDPDQMCVCATASGIPVAVISRAALDSGFSQDVIAQARCIGQKAGLAYTEPAESTAVIGFIGGKTRPPVSPSVP